MLRYKLIEEGCCYDTVEAETAEAAMDIARSNVDWNSYNPGDDGAAKSLSIEVRVVNADDDSDSLSETIMIEPPEPDCVGGRDSHDWVSPHEVLGGLKENPGVFGKGGGVLIKEFCRHCGVYRITDTWDQNTRNGMPETTVTYQDPDLASLDWIGQAEEID